MSDDIHEVYAVRYAEHARMRSENYIFGDPHDEMTSIAYYVWVIKGPHGTFVCDTGFDEAAAKERGRKIIHPVGEGLKALGVEPDKVETRDRHPHALGSRRQLRPVSQRALSPAGHRDGLRHRPLHVPPRCCASRSARATCTPWSRKIYAYRVDFHDGVEELAPGITVHKIGGHSKGLQCVRVKTKRGYVVVASDCDPSLLAHRRRPRVPDHLFRRRHARGLQDDPRSSPTSRQHIVPGHDPEVLEALSGGERA